MQQMEFFKTVPYLESVKSSRILVVYGENHFGEIISPLIIQRFAEETVKERLTYMDEKKTELGIIVKYLGAIGYTKKN